MRVVWHDGASENIQMQVGDRLVEAVADHIDLLRSELNGRILKMLFSFESNRMIVRPAGKRLPRFNFRGAPERLKMTRPNFGGP